MLVGHSYGGMVITGVADRLADRLAALIYLDALVPQDRQCVLDLQPPERREAFSSGGQVAAGCGRAHGRLLRRAGSGEAGLGGRQMHPSRSTPCSSGCVSRSAPGQGARKLYILCTDPPLAYMRKFYDWAVASPGWEVTRAGHRPRRHDHATEDASGAAGRMGLAQLEHYRRATIIFARKTYVQLRDFEPTDAMVVYGGWLS